jgi:hypothetical protein
MGWNFSKYSMSVKRFYLADFFLRDTVYINKRRSWTKYQINRCRHRWCCNFSNIHPSRWSIFEHFIKFYIQMIDARRSFWIQMQILFYDFLKSHIHSYVVIIFIQQVTYWVNLFTITIYFGDFLKSYSSIQIFKDCSDF